MKNKNNQGFLPASPYIIWSSLFIVIPLLIVIFFAFTTKSGDTYKFSLENFQRLLDTNYLKVFGRSILLAAEATLGCLILGYPVAYLRSCHIAPDPSSTTNRNRYGAPWPQDNPC